ncbi:MAG: alanyl-tRNA editing protein [Candidatus Lokiarchaeota archaeon]|nr:alanyl-tRNA editing protein [Candidatus Lokiarchaeota archaeon]
MTIPLYWEKPYKKQFTGKIIAIKKGAIILDKTLFYATAGNQIHDTGTLTINGKYHKVINVEKENEEILHFIHPPPSNNCIGQKVKANLDWERRYAIMKAHTSQHIFSAVMLQQHNVTTNHANIKPDEVTIEFEPFTQQQLESVVKEINILYTSQNRKIISHTLDYNTAQQRYANKIRGKVPKMESIRILEVEGVDYNTCGGTHVRTTTEIGPIIIIKINRNCEVTYFCGKKAIEHVSLINFGAITVSQKLACSMDDFEQIFTNKFEKFIISAKNETKLGYRVMELLPFSPGIDIEGIIYRYLEDPINKKAIMNGFELLGQNAILIAKLEDNLYLILSSSTRVPSNEFVNHLCGKFGGKGGGNSHNAQGKLETEPHDFRNEIVDFIKNKTNHG